MGRCGGRGEDGTGMAAACCASPRCVAHRVALAAASASLGVSEYRADGEEVQDSGDDQCDPESGQPRPSLVLHRTEEAVCPEQEGFGYHGHENKAERVSHIRGPELFHVFLGDTQALSEYYHTVQGVLPGHARCASKNQLHVNAYEN